jgi:hypothetical protein
MTFGIRPAAWCSFFKKNVTVERNFLSARPIPARRGIM